MKAAENERRAILLPQTNWKDLYFYRKADVIYQLTVAFCQRFLPKFDDRTVDQMVQAARAAHLRFSSMRFEIGNNQNNWQKQLCAGQLARAFPVFCMSTPMDF